MELPTCSVQLRVGPCAWEGQVSLARSGPGSGGRPGWLVPLEGPGLIRWREPWPRRSGRRDRLAATRCRSWRGFLRKTGPSRGPGARWPGRRRHRGVASLRALHQRRVCGDVEPVRVGFQVKPGADGAGAAKPIPGRPGGGCSSTGGTVATRETCRTRPRRRRWLV